METQTIQYPAEILSALGKEAEEFEEEARLLLALKYYETGKLSTGLAAQLAGVPRSTRREAPFFNRQIVIKILQFRLLWK